MHARPSRPGRPKGVLASGSGPGHREVIAYTVFRRFGHHNTNPRNPTHHGLCLVVSARSNGEGGGVRWREMRFGFPSFVAQICPPIPPHPLQTHFLPPAHDMLPVPMLSCFSSVAIVGYTLRGMYGYCTRKPNTQRQLLEWPVPDSGTLPNPSPSPSVQHACEQGW